MKKILLFVSLMSMLLILIMLFMSCDINNQNVQTEEQTGDTIDLTVVLESKISELAPGFVNLTVIRGPGSTSNVVGSWGFHKIYKASNRAGYAFISPDGFLVLVNVTGGYVVYDVEGNNQSTNVRVQYKTARPTDWAWHSSKTAGQAVSLTANEWNSFCTKINLFRQYKGLSNYTFTTATSGGVITASIVNQAVNAISAMSPPTSAPSTVTSKSSVITASFFNTLRSSLNSIR